MTDTQDANGKLWPEEQRLTPVGRLLRSTSFDEISQLIHLIIRADTSLKGLRPLHAKYIPFYIQEEFCPHKVKPGITGSICVNASS